jgi:hypothetical protein
MYANLRTPIDKHRWPGVYAGLHIHIQMRQSRVPSGYGLYISMGSDGTSASAFCDLKFTYHLYPVNLATI